MNRWTRREFLKTLSALAGLGIGLSARASAAAPERPLLGAIRWDAWHGALGGPGQAVERSLGPGRYHWRLPFFARVISEKEVKIDGATPEVMEREIDYARTAGLDYWAFLLYDENDPMSLGLKHYLASPRKGDPRFCAIIEPRQLGAAKDRDAMLGRLARLAGDAAYLKVAGGRPLLYLGFVGEPWIGACGGPPGARKVLDGLRERFRKEGRGDPYVVLMDFNPQQGRKLQRMLGADAIGAYAASGGDKAAPYRKLAERTAGFWERCKASGAPVVPLAMSGWDRRPRVEHPVPWEKEQQPGKGMDLYYQTPTPEELAGHLSQALRWVADNPAACPARVALVYAWNENDEGGWLVPTLKAGGGIDTTRVEAVGRMIRAWK